MRRHHVGRRLASTALVLAGCGQLFLAAGRAEPPAARRLSAIEVLVEERGLVVSLAGDGLLTPSSIHEAEDGPPRLVVDLPEVTSWVPGITPVGVGPVRDIRVVAHSLDPLVTRVVFELRRATTYEIAGSDDGSGRLLTFIFPLVTASDDLSQDGLDQDNQLFVPPELDPDDDGLGPRVRLARVVLRSAPSPLPSSTSRWAGRSGRAPRLLLSARPTRSELALGLAPVPPGPEGRRAVVTGSDGRASATYTVPSPATSGPSVDTGEVFTISVTPVGSNFSNAVSRGLTIRLVPRGTVIPSFSATPGFGFTPETPAVFNDVLFTTACLTVVRTDCVRDPAEIVTSYRWVFGDGRSGSRPTASHTYDLAGTHLVTLTIGDDKGGTSERTRAVIMAAGMPPMAAVSVSPADPKEQDSIFFNASGSTAAPGRTIVPHAWDFGDGSTGFGVTASHAYHTAGAYTVTLNVTDDRGQVGTASALVVVKATGPTASFVFSPIDPAIGRTIFFNGQSSEPGPERSIMTYQWNFGDGVATSPNVDHTYTSAGTYDVQLTVTNDAGESDTASQTIPIVP